MVLLVIIECHGNVTELPTDIPPLKTPDTDCWSHSGPAAGSTHSTLREHRGIIPGTWHKPPLELIDDPYM